MTTGETQLDRALPQQRERTTVAAGLDPGKLAFRIGFLVLLAFFTILFLYPLVWLVFASLKPGSEVFSGGLIGSQLMWSNYPKLISDQPVLQWTWNSVLVTLLAASTVTISSALVAFAFAYFRFPFRNLVFGLVLGSMMLPGAVTMIPNYLIWDFLGWNNTLVPLWAGNLFASPFYIFMLRQFFLGLPRELFDAARVDGANYLRMWWSVALPLTRAALIVVFVFELKVAWTDLVKPLIFLRDLTTFTLPAGLKAIVDNPSIGGEKHFELLAVGGVIVTVPMIIVFFFAQRYFIEGISTTGSTGR
ncbi:MAG TPA: carbohydrate ABC transporter permease [Candidatus Limnocylindria bacterium]|nr:carbohydrate ABC transporter permease [Candidatus Limnocylindria bacterium]